MHDIRRAHFGRSFQASQWRLSKRRDPRLDYYDRKGRRISMARWAALTGRRHFRYKRVAYTVLPAQGVRVSTVWLGMNHNFWFSGPPLIFETMVFPLDSFTDLGQWRYSTERHARKGHNRTVHLVRTGEVDIYPWDDADTPEA